MVVINITPEYGWQCFEKPGVTLWFKGYLYNETINDLADKVFPLTSIESISAFLKKLDGHYAIVAKYNNATLAAVDRVRSIPLFYAKNKQTDTWHLDDQAKRLASTCNFGPDDVCSDSALSIGMSGYTIGHDTLYNDLSQLAAGDFVRVTNGATPVNLRREQYYSYAPYKLDSAAVTPTIQDLSSVTLGVFEKLAKSANGKMIVVPLSAGLDSRLVASALQHLNYPNLKTFSYGRAGNFEAKTAEGIARRLGVEWCFVPYTSASQREAICGSEHQEYLSFADSCASVPFKQDFLAIRHLKERGWIAKNAIIVNGNSGDFITGGHIPLGVQTTPQDLSPEQRKKRIVDALVTKHYSLWDSLRSMKNITRIERKLRLEIDESNADLDDPSLDFGVYESTEFYDRQSKYVITGQRIYEYFGFEWRLPLWDNSYLDFWEKVPLEQKKNQGMYRDMLEEENWGGVWRGIPVNAKTIRPHWLAPLRILAKLLHAPLGRAKWHRFERRFFQYWMDNLYGQAPYLYRDTAMDRRGARHAIAWYTESYLKTHGLALDGTPLNNR